MPRVSTITASLNQALKDASQRIVQEALVNLPADIEMGRLFDEFSKSGYADDFRTLTLSDFVAAVNGAPGAAGPRPGRRPGAGPKGKAKGKAKPGKAMNTRTQAGREAFDAVVADYLQAQGMAGAEEIRKACGGTSQQVRQSLKRMAGEGRVKITGEKRLTRYTWKGGAAGSRPAASARRGAKKSSRRKTKAKRKTKTKRK